MPTFYTIIAHGKMELTAEHEIEAETPFQRGVRVQGYDPSQLVFTPRKVARIDDMPWVTSAAELVSDRLRILLEEACPGAVQFLPVTIKGPGSEQIPGPYWFANWLRVIDCMNREHSMGIHSITGKPYVKSVVVDPGLVPDDATIFRVKDFVVQAIVTKKIRDLCKKHKITGMLLSEVPCEPAPPPRTSNT